MGIGALPCADSHGCGMYLIGLVTALRDEARCITSGPIPFNEKISLNDHALLWLSGMGSHAAQAAAEGLCRHGATALVSFGVAGALHADLQPGDLVLPNKIASEQQSWQVDCAWQQRLRQMLRSNLTVVDGVLADSAVPLTDERSKKDLARSTGACAVDMESAAVAAVAAQNGIPFVAVRAIIDPLHFSPPPALLGAVYPDGRVNPLYLTRLVLGRSVQIGTLIKMGAGMRAARKTLTQVMRMTGPELEFHTSN